MTGADAEQQRPAPAPERPAAETPAPTTAAAHTDAQPAFPWSTEEFVAGRDDVDDEPAGPEAPAAAPARSARPTNWDVTDQIPDEELPWWRRPKDDH